MITLQPHGGALQIVCLGAHPDDIEIGCGGTLLEVARAREIRAAVIVATGTGARREEATNAVPRFLPAAAVQTHLLELRDGFLPSHWGSLKEELERVADSFVAPDIVFAPRLDDAHQDHRVVAELVHTVWRDSLVLHYEIPKWDGDLARASHYVPLAPETARHKVELLSKCFPSQVGRDWWDDESFLSLMRLRGIECRQRYAEAFVASKTVLSLREHLP